MALKVSELAASAGVSADAIRYYERLGLLPEVERTPAGYRQFAEADARRIRFIKDAQRLGLTLGDIGELLKIQDDGACRAATRRRSWTGAGAGKCRDSRSDRAPEGAGQVERYGMFPLRCGSDVEVRDRAPEGR